MKRTKALGVAFVAALSGSLLVGCTSDDATTATSPTPPAQLLVGKWLTEFPDVTDFADGAFVILELEEGGVWTYKWGPSYNRVVQIGSGTYTVNADDTITWLGGDCVEGDRASTHTRWRVTSSPKPPRTNHVTHAGTRTTG